MSEPKPPPILDAIVDVVLAYKPKAKTDGAKKAEAQDKEVREENEQTAARRTKAALAHDSIEVSIL